MSDAVEPSPSPRLLMQLGAILLLLGLLTGLFAPFLAIPRMGLTSHLEGVLNGMLLILYGLIWPRLALSNGQRAVAFWTILYATFTNWATTLLSAASGAAGTMPLAGGGSVGPAWLEMVIFALLMSLSLAIIISVGLVIYGLRRAP